MIQGVMGYDALLPSVDGNVDGAEGHRTWTRAQALREILQETNELMDEFTETKKDEEDGTVVDAEPSTMDG